MNERTACFVKGSLIDRLRDGNPGGWVSRPGMELMKEAADEIERLRRATADQTEEIRGYRRALNMDDVS